MRTPLLPLDDLRFSNTTEILQKKKKKWFIGVEVGQETSAPPPKKNPGSAPVYVTLISFFLKSYPLCRVSFLYCNDACVSKR